MRKSAIFGRAFLDGFSMAGIFGKLSLPGAKTSAELLACLENSDPTVEAVQALFQDGQRSFRYAVTGLLCGSLALLACLGLSVFLVTHNHPIVGAAVIAISPATVFVELLAKLLGRANH
jgi:hypothetical protein